MNRILVALIPLLFGCTQPKVEPKLGYPYSPEQFQEFFSRAHPGTKVRIIQYDKWNWSKPMYLVASIPGVDGLDGGSRSWEHTYLVEQRVRGTLVRLGITMDYKARDIDEFLKKFKHPEAASFTWASGR